MYADYSWSYFAASSDTNIGFYGLVILKRLSLISLLLVDTLWFLETSGYFEDLLLPGLCIGG
jgi:hypothetical protein